MALTSSGIDELLGIATKLYPRENTRRLALLADVFEAYYDFKTCEAVLRAHATANIWLVVPDLVEELKAAHCDRATQIQTVVKVATMESTTRQQRIAQQQRDADAEMARMDELIAQADAETIAEATRRVIERNPYLAKLIKRDLKDSPTLKSFVAAELSQMEREQRVA